MRWLKSLGGTGAAIALVLALLGGCTPGHSSSRSDKSDQSGDSSPPASSGATNQGGETKNSGYTDPRFHYVITGPGPLKAQPDGTSLFVGEDERLQVAIVQGGKAADPLALAQADLDSLKTTPDFKVLNQPGTVSLAGQRGAKFTYSYTDKSHTGNQAKFFAVRYYIPKDNTVLAVVTYQDIATEFDPSEADGFANSFHWQ